MTLLDHTIETIATTAMLIQVGDVIHRQHRWRVMARSYNGPTRGTIKLRCHREGDPSRNQTITLRADARCYVERARRLAAGECRWCGTLNTNDDDCWKCGR